MNIFVDSNSELRSGWKFAAFCAIFLFLFFAIVFLIQAFVGQAVIVDELVLLGLNAAVILIPTVLTHLVIARFVDHKPLKEYGIGFYKAWHKEFLAGIGIAAGMLAIVLAGCAAFGDLDMRWSAGMATPGRLALTVVLLMIAAANEELLFRGFPLQVLMREVRVWLAVLFVSLIFGVLHLSNPNASLLGGANTIVAGILLSIAYLRTRWLWLPYGIHIGWNAGIGWVFGFPLSGLDIASLWTTNVRGNPLIVGGNYGPEEGLLGTFIFAAAAIIVRRGFKK